MNSSDKNKYVIGITGEICAGKDTLVNALVDQLKKDKMGVEVLHSSDIIKQIFTLIDIVPKREDFHNITIYLRKYYGKNFFTRVIRKKISLSKGTIILWSGLRSKYDLELLRQYPNNFLVYIKSPVEDRYRRLLTRDRDKGDKTKTKEEFLEDCNKSTETYIRTLKEKSDYVIHNFDGQFENSLDHFMNIVTKVVK